jgi:hypothetical protein
MSEEEEKLLREHAGAEVTSMPRETCKTRIQMIRAWHILLVALPLLAWAGYWLLFMGGWDRVTARPVISAIEAYRQREGRLPEPSDTALLQSLGFEVRVGLHPDYQKIGSEDYVVTVLKGFDGPYWLYESANKKWRYGYPPAK